MPLAPHSIPRYNKRIGALAQLGERKVRNLEVRGSIPLCSTNDEMQIPTHCSCVGIFYEEEETSLSIRLYPHPRNESPFRREENPFVTGKRLTA